MEQSSEKVYERTVDPNGADSISKIARRIAPGTRVLDLGCGPGALGRWLKADKGCVVDGVEHSPKSAALAQPHYRKLAVADLEREPLAAHFADARYDYIVCADVLEHLRQPETLLRQLPSLLTPSGRIIISIPNVGYAGLVGALINGEFRYRDEGLLDATHLRFFTRKSLLAWLTSCELQVARIDTVTMPIDRSEFADDHIESLPPALLRTLLGATDALTYQFIVEAAPAPSGAPAVVEPPAETAAFTFLAQLYYRGNQPFDDAHSVTVHARMGVERQRVELPIPPSPTDLVALRFDPSNRPGYLRLYGMALFDAQRNCVWKWSESTSLDHVGSHQVRFVRDDSDSLLVVLEGDDGWFELPIDAELLARVRDGGSVEIDLSWPQSPDSYAVIRRLLSRDSQLQRIAALEDERARWQRERSDMRSHIRTLSREIKDLQEELRAAHAQLAAVHDSLTLRVTRPLFAIVNRLRRS